LITPAHYLRTTILTCLLMAGLPFATAQERATAAPTSRTAPIELEDPLHAWFKEQDRVLDDILLRLSRIETLVREIHWLVQQLQTPAAPEERVAPLTHTSPNSGAIPAAASPEKTTGMLEILENREIQLAGGGLLLVILLLWSRRRKASRQRALKDEGSKPVAAALPPTAPPLPAAPPKSSPAVAEPMPYISPPEPTQSKSRADTGGGNSATRSHEQALELAEIMLAMGLGQGAAQTLTEQIHNEPKQGLRNWLKLLEIYRQNGQQDDFERSAEELRQHFNVLPEDWLVQPEMQRSIEDYPHIAARLTELWGKPSCAGYLGNLLNDNRDGIRAGFPQSVAEELLLLMAIINDDGAIEQAAAAIKADSRT